MQSYAELGQAKPTSRKLTAETSEYNIKLSKLCQINFVIIA